MHKRFSIAFRNSLDFFIYKMQQTQREKNKRAKEREEKKTLRELDSIGEWDANKDDERMSNTWLSGLYTFN